MAEKGPQNFHNCPLTLPYTRCITCLGKVNTKPVFNWLAQPATQKKTLANFKNCVFQKKKNNRNETINIPSLEIPVELHTIFNLKSCFWGTSFP